MLQFYLVTTSPTKFRTVNTCARIAVGSCAVQWYLWDAIVGYSPNTLDMPNLSIFHKVCIQTICIYSWRLSLSPTCAAPRHGDNWLLSSPVVAVLLESWSRVSDLQITPHRHALKQLTWMVWMAILVTKFKELEFERRSKSRNLQHAVLKSQSHWCHLNA